MGEEGACEGRPSDMASSAMLAAAAASEKGRSVGGEGVALGLSLSFCFSFSFSFSFSLSVSLSFSFSFSARLWGTLARRFLNQRTTLWGGMEMEEASWWSSAEVGDGFASKRVIRAASWSGEAL